MANRKLKLHLGLRKTNNVIGANYICQTNKKLSNYNPIDTGTRTVYL